MDGSVTPSIASGSLNAARIVLAEKAALIRGEPPLPPAAVPVHIAPTWATAQR